MNLHTILTEPDQTYFITDPELIGQFYSLGHLKWAPYVLTSRQSCQQKQCAKQAQMPHNIAVWRDLLCGNMEIVTSNSNYLYVSVNSNIVKSKIDSCNISKKL